MSNELFKESEVSLKSPRLRWMDRHGVHLLHITGVDDIVDEPYRACCGSEYAYGSTQDEALTNLCRNLGIKLWNEEEG